MGPYKCRPLEIFVVNTLQNMAVAGVLFRFSLG